MCVATFMEEGQPMAAATQGEMKKTLSLTGLTINAMALIAPGAFLWTTFQLQSAQTSGGSTTGMDMLPGLLFVLILAFLTAYSYSELANLYPQAGAGSSYYFAEAAFLDKEKKAHFQFARLSKFVVGWISHLYYWVYPGIMVAFTGTLLVYILSLYNVTLNQPGQIAAVVVFSALTGYIAFRGISGSTMTAIIINVIQLTALVGFSVLAIVFRLVHPELHYSHSSPFSVVLPHNITNLAMQGTIAILLLVGFESVTALGAEAINPKRDVRRAILLSLAIQGAAAYVIEYFAANFFISDALRSSVGKTVVSGYNAAAVSAAPIGDMIRYIGDNMLGGTGFALTLILAVTVLIALIGTTLACLNTGVRITYVMGRDKEMPSILGLLHGKYATPHFGVLALALVSMGFGAYGVLSVDNLTQITLASNTGTFLVYGMTNLVALVAFAGRKDRHILKHYIVPGLGALANVAMLGAIVYLNLVSGGSTATDTIIALTIVGTWIVVGVIWLVVNSATGKRSILHKEKPLAAAGEI
jgi:basic amino acid/polyamine antiporter, APA family